MAQPAGLAASSAELAAQPPGQPMLTNMTRGGMQGGPPPGYAMVPFTGDPNAAATSSQIGGSSMVQYVGNAPPPGNAMMPYDPNAMQASSKGLQFTVHDPFAGREIQFQPKHVAQSDIYQKPPDVQRKPKQSIGKRLQKGWNKDGIMRGLDITIHDYSKRHGGRTLLTKEKGVVAQGPRSQELGILDKVVKETAEGAKMIPAEEVLTKTLRAGYREYIDYALDEVERFAQTDHTGAAPQFDWKMCGDAFDVPALRRSRAENAVGGGPQDFVATTKHSNMFKMDFIRDCCRKADGGNPALALRPSSAKSVATKSSITETAGDDTEQLLEELFNDGAPDLGHKVVSPWRPEYAGPWASEYTLV
mmetsp:Transcript_80670/g.147089  ORF Transcript_80670/g.147089 Transcript_80670/m.147089 type:complete len:361 (-) Transcript_80670:107-1189(-)